MSLPAGEAHDSYKLSTKIPWHPPLPNDGRSWCGWAENKSRHLYDEGMPAKAGLKERRLLWVETFFDFAFGGCPPLGTGSSTTTLSPGPSPPGRTVKARLCRLRLNQSPVRFRVLPVFRLLRLSRQRSRCLERLFPHLAPRAVRDDQRIPGWQA